MKKNIYLKVFIAASIFFMLVISNLVKAEADGIPDSLDRGHRLILKHGFQIQALTFPGAYPSGESWDAARWAESNFNTPNIHEWGNPETFGVAPGRKWSRWMSWIYCTNSYGPYLRAHELPYLENLVSLQATDEKELGDSSIVNIIKETFDIWENTYPDIIRYTSQHGNDGADIATHQNYQSIAKPDMVNMFSYDYKDGEGIEGGSQPKWFSALGKFRLLGLYGNDGTGNQPIPSSCFYQCFIHEGARNVGLSELSICQFAPIVFGYKFTIAFFYNDPNPGVLDLEEQIFNSDGDSQPNAHFYQSAENNAEIKRLAPALERLISRSGSSINYVWVKPGQYEQGGWFGGTKDNPTPDYCAEWHSAVDPYITSVSANNPSSWNDGLRGDTWIGYFNPLHESFDGPDYNDELYFMVMNGLTSVDALPASIMQQITLNFDFGGSGITSLQRLNRTIGKPEIVNLIHDGGSSYHITLEIDGGEADLFKFNTGAPFVGNVDAPENIFPTNFASIIAPVTFSATPFKSPFGYSFSASQWQVSAYNNFSILAWDSGEISPLETFTASPSAIPEGTYYWRVRYKNSEGIWSDWSLEPTSFLLTIPEPGTAFEDTFNVSGSGDINYNFDEVGRQSGDIAPMTYNFKGGSSTISDAGAYAGKCHMDGISNPSFISPDYNFIGTNNFSIEYEITRLAGGNTQQWDAFAFGTDGAYKIPHEGNTLGMEIVLYEHGWYHIYINNIQTGNFHFAELEFNSNATLKIKFVVSQDDFDGSGDAQVAFFINDRPYPLSGGFTGENADKFIYTFAGGFTNNYMTFVTDMYDTSKTHASIDNFKVTASVKNIETSLLTNDDDSGITAIGAKYSHAVNFADTASPIINGVTFTGSGAALSGSNWEIKTANILPPTLLPLASTYSITPNVSANSSTLLTNVFYSATPENACALTLTGLTPGQTYHFAFHSMAVEAVGERRSYIATSDGAIISDVDQDQYDSLNGQTLTYEYTANANGIFSISTTPINNTWGFYAFSNKQLSDSYIYITNANTTIAYNINNYTITGTNSSDIIGSMNWSNSQTGNSGTIPAATSWTKNIDIATGVNIITVSGKNNFGTVFSDDVIITREDPPGDSSSWIVDADGNWQDSPNWHLNTIANGSGHTAYFTNNISADRFVYLNQNQTIGKIIASDISSDVKRWALENGGSGVLTLDNYESKPIIDVEGVGLWGMTIALPVEGTNGFIKTGIASLPFWAANNIAGTVIISEGAIDVMADGVFKNADVVVENAAQFNVGAPCKTLNPKSITVESGGKIRSTATATYTIDCPLTLNGGDALSFENNGLNVTNNGAITLNATTRIFNWGIGGSMVMNGAVSGNGDLDLIGQANGAVHTKTYYLNAQNSYNGNTFLSGFACSPTFEINGHQRFPNSDLIFIIYEWENENTSLYVDMNNFTQRVVNLSIEPGNSGGDYIEIRGAANAEIGVSGNMNIVGPGLVKLSGGKISLDGNADFKSLLTIENSSFVANGTLGGNGGLEIGNGGEINGIGNVASLTVKSGGKLSPGYNIGTLNIGNLIMESGSIYNWDFSDSSVDSINVVGTVSLPAIANSIEVVVDSEAESGTYTLISSANISSGNETAFWSNDDQVNFQQNGTNIEIEVIPEPAFFSLVGLIFLTLFRKTNRFK